MKRLSLILCGLLVLSGVYKVCFAAEKADEDVPPPPPPTGAFEEYKKLKEEAAQQKKTEMQGAEEGKGSEKTNVPLPVGPSTDFLEEIKKGKKLGKGTGKQVIKVPLLEIGGLQEPYFGPVLQKNAHDVLNQYAQAKDNALALQNILSMAHNNLGISVKPTECEAFDAFAKKFRERYQADKDQKNLFSVKKLVIQGGIKPKTSEKQKPKIVTLFLSERHPKKQTTWISISDQKPDVYQAFFRALKDAYESWEKTLKKEDFSTNEKIELVKKTLKDKVTTVLSSNLKTEKGSFVSITEDMQKHFLIKDGEYDKMVNKAVEYYTWFFKQPPKASGSIEEKPAKNYKNFFPDLAIAFDAIK